MLRAIAVLPLTIGLLSAASATSAVDDIIQKNIEARGGLQKIHAIQTLRLIGTAKINGQIDGQITLLLKRPNLYRLDMNLPMGSIVQGFDGVDAWAIDPFSGSTTPHKLAASESRSVRDNADIDGPLVDYRAKGNSIEIAGTDDTGSGPAYKLKLTMKSGAVTYIWIDAKTWLESQITEMQTQNGKPVEARIQFSNYKTVSGVQLPFSREHTVGPVTMKIDFVSGEANQPVDDSVFHMPATSTP